MDRRDYYYKQLVTDAELDAGLDGVENALWNIVADYDLGGIATGLAVTQRGAGANGTVDVAAGPAYDSTGKRCRVPSTQNVNLATDHFSVTTNVSSPGNAKVLSVFLKFARALSDPRTDGLGATVYFINAESFQLLVVQGAEATAGTEVGPALQPDMILLADVRRIYGQTTFVNADINPYTPNRRQIAAVGFSTAEVQAIVAASLAASPTITSPAIGGTPNFTATSIRATGHARYKLYSDVDDVDTTDATVTDFWTWTILDEAITTVTVEISAIKSDGSLGASFVRRVKIKRDGGTVTVDDVEDLYSQRDAGWETTEVTIDHSGSTGRVRVTGKASTSMNWGGCVTRAEHNHA